MVFLVPGRMRRSRPSSAIPVVQVAEGDAGLLLQGVEVGVVGDVGQAHHPDPEAAVCFPAAPAQALAPQGDAVFFGQDQVRHVGHHPQDRPPGAALDDLHPLLEQGRVPPELVDDETGEQAALPGGQQVKGADGGREDPAPVDVRHQEHRGPGLAWPC